MVMKKSKQAAVVICLLSCLIVVCPTRAEEFDGVKDGYYLGAMFAYNHMSGEFDDSITFESEDETDLDLFNVPDVDDGAGFGVFSAGGLASFPLRSATSQPSTIQAR